jgi:hypothetical protein
LGTSLPALADDFNQRRKSRRAPLAGVKEGIVKIISPFADGRGIPDAQ